MTDGQPNEIENRMDRLEATLSSAGDLLLRASAVAQSNAEAIERTEAAIDRNVEAIQALTQRMDTLTQRVDSLAAASEQHDRILDYLLRKEAEGTEEG